MKILCGPKTFDFSKTDSDLDVVLYSQAITSEQGCAGEPIANQIKRRKLAPTPRAWDFLSIALSCFSADLAGHRKKSPDGWTREFDSTIAVSDPIFWNSVTKDMEAALQFLSTDIWSLKFVEGGFQPVPHKRAGYADGDSVALLSGGMDSLIGAIDLESQGNRPITVSHVSRGDRDKQESFPKIIGNGLNSILLSHAARVPNGETPSSQRSRSIIFIAYAVLISSCLDPKKAGSPKTCFVSENGFISLNPPLTPMRVGSLSTRTTHPTYFKHLKTIFTLAGFDLLIQNNYSLKTKGEMLEECKDQKLLKQIAHTSTSCGRYLYYGYNHCGRCVPCMVRRSAFLKWGVKDDTYYKFENLGINNSDHAGFDDVRAAAIACLEESEIGTRRWAGATLDTTAIPDESKHLEMLGRGLEEIRVLLKSYGIV